MSTHKSFDRICALALSFCLLVTLLCYNASALGIRAASSELGYESRLFSTDRVHTIDIAIDDWEAFLSTAQSEEYSVCDVTIDGETIQDVGIRGKGNTSLSQVSSMDSQRYSFKVEFDQYDSTRTYHGLDKLCLNNLIQDNTLMKDYLTYQMMQAFGAAAPLCSFVWITVNGEDWGLYLAVEAIEDSFLYRNYGSDYGQLYKPDSMSMGGGRGNGREFDMNDWQQQDSDSSRQTLPDRRGSNNAMPTMPEDFDFSQMFGGGKGGFGGMGSSDVKLQYIDDDPDSYGNIFDSAKTDLTAADRTRLIGSLEVLSRMDSSAVDIEAVIRYFVVHNYVVNGDSYTGSMIHNYYLYEEDGLLSMLPWDYNLAFGGFQGGNASSSVNDDIDAPLSCSGNGDRPMMDWLLQGGQYTLLYHSFFSDFLESVDPQAIIDRAYALIAPYVERDPTKFCTAKEFEAGVSALKTFCDLRTQSVQAQLAGEDTVVDASSLDISAMGSMNMGGGMGGGFDRGNRGQWANTQTVPAAPGEQPTDAQPSEMPAMPGFGGGMMPQIPGQQPDSSVQQTVPTAPADDNGAQTPDMGSMQRPDMGSMQFPGQPTTAAPQTGSLIPLAISAVILLIGLLVAFLYKR